MDLQYFPHFIRKNYPEIADITNEEINEIGLQFKEYIKEVYKDSQDKLDKIWDISPMKVIMNSEHPLKTNGYEPALIIHFGNYVKKASEHYEV